MDISRKVVEEIVVGKADKVVNVFNIISQDDEALEPVSLNATVNFDWKEAAEDFFVVDVLVVGEFIATRVRLVSCGYRFSQLDFTKQHFFFMLWLR